jgi:small conductance mechanosensitive channel
MSNATMKLIASHLPSLLLAFGLGLGLWGIHWLLIGRHRDLGNERRFPRQLLILALSLIAVLAVILVLPIEESSRNRLIGLIGLLVSGTIAFSSTNLLANLMGGILLRTTKPFRIGDFIRAEQHFGRVTERGLFDTEIQTESRELISLPNAYLISHPITATRSSGAIVSAQLSLGYDIHHSQAEPLLLSAAEATGLKEPWVHVLELGNFAVTYRVSGLLEDTERLITAHSNLCRSVLDTLHGNGIEIMSPTYMNQRQLGEDSTTIPKQIEVPTTTDSEGGEHLVFDKAEEAKRREQKKKQLVKEIQELEASLKETDDDEKIRIKKNIESARERLKALEESEAKANSEDDVPERTAAGDAEKPRA